MSSRLAISFAAILILSALTIDTRPWVAPLGIPCPSFGITETHRMYDNATFDFGNGPEPYRDAGNGPYSHYVDNTIPAARDTDNPFGTPAVPRKTIPWPLPAGSVVELHGGPYLMPQNNMPYTAYLVARGTVAAPVFIRGTSETQKIRFGAPNGYDAGRQGPIVMGNAQDFSTYLILENLDCYNLGILAPSHHVAFRASAINGDDWEGGIDITDWTTANAVHDVVIYNNQITHCGRWTATWDQDKEGIAVTERAYNIWILDNEISYTSGDCVQINAANTRFADIHHVYAGRNHCHHSRQSGLFVKAASDVVFSQNTIHDMRIPPDWASHGQCLGCAYSHRRLWFLFNDCYDSDTGFCISHIYTGNEGPHYVIGNVFHNIRYARGSNVDDPYDYGFAIQIWSGGAGFYLCDNTIVNCDRGIGTCATTVPHYISNNILSGLAPQARHLLFNADWLPEQLNANVTLKHLLTYPQLSINWGGILYSTWPTFLAQTGKGQDCRTGDPVFAHEDAGDYSLGDGSAAINAGETPDVYDIFLAAYGLDIRTDGTGLSRPQEGAWDIGAREAPFIHGRVTLQDFFGDNATIRLTVTIRSGGQIRETHVVSLDANGQFAFPTAFRGICGLTAKASHWLRQTRSGIDTTQSPIVEFSLLNGDVNGDNRVTFEDFSILQTHYGESVDPDTNGDLNGDGRTTFQDFGILQRNYGRVGDP